MVEEIDTHFREKYSTVTPATDATINTESWAEAGRAGAAGWAAGADAAGADAAGATNSTTAQAPCAAPLSRMPTAVA
nr:hypothetical protein [uncultured Alistipes sp.]